MTKVSSYCNVMAVLHLMEEEVFDILADKFVVTSQLYFTKTSGFSPRSRKSWRFAVTNQMSYNRTMISSDIEIVILGGGQNSTSSIHFLDSSRSQVTFRRVMLICSDNPGE